MLIANEDYAGKPSIAGSKMEIYIERKEEPAVMH